ncbi:hypothetical protein O6H91_03G080200 [Diphasiastrum complanatum]|uniref:Uncharacterized protein n=1 Tax=Diphasiastrum complanatum TaxID=34168 RepID=A0ACC2E7W8_DIPCM|nr:hypothetical protein O6H91_03G080200 [Diphasiastrum complanatum]
MSAAVTRFFGPAATVVAALVTSVASAEIPDKMHARTLPFLCFATHPSMPFPPCGSLSDNPHAGSKMSPLGSLPLSRPSSSNHISVCVDFVYNTAGWCAKGEDLVGSTGFSFQGISLPALRYESALFFFPRLRSLFTSMGSPSFTSLPDCGGKLSWISACTLGQHAALHSTYLHDSANSILISSIPSSIFSSPNMHFSSLSSSARAPISCAFNSCSASPVFRRSSAYLFPLFRSFTPHESLYVWHSPANDLGFAKKDIAPSKDNVPSSHSKLKPAMTVVLLGWLGAQQQHLKKYAEWYLARGINAVTFVIPMRDLISFKLGHKAEEQIDYLAEHIALWLNESDGENRDKVLLFHTFSNAGWLTYGVILERLLKRDSSLIDKIKGCVVDSAPVAELDPQVWASGFFAALMKKGTVTSHNRTQIELMQGGDAGTMKTEIQPHVTEVALLAMLEKFFSVFLQLPYVKQRLSEVVTVLSKQQPQCPQLYIYSSADQVIPVKFVEAFIDEQRRAGRIVRACNLYSSPHVDHYRSFPEKYSSQLNNFFQECLPQWSVQ